VLVILCAIQGRVALETGPAEAAAGASRRQGPSLHPKPQAGQRRRPPELMIIKTLADDGAGQKLQTPICRPADLPS
jgi:hypothetical protein